MNGVNITKFLADWKIDPITSSLTKSIASKEDLQQALTEAYMETMHHEMVFQSRGRVSRFIRSTNLSNSIAQNSMIKEALEAVTNKRKTTKQPLHI